MDKKDTQLIDDSIEGQSLVSKLSKNCANDMPILDRLITIAPMNVH
jgi:hypothetical protein